MTDPRITIVIPCHDDGELLLEAIRSVDEAEPVEIVVVDDGSTDERTRTVVDDLASTAVQVVRQPENRGLGAARTAGLEASRAPYVFPLDADDLAIPGTFAAMADRLESAPRAVVCFGDYQEFGTHTVRRQVAQRLDPYRIAYRNDFGAALFKRSILEAVGGWAPAKHDVTGYEDWHVWMGLAERGAAGVYMGSGFVTYRRRLHGHRMLSDARCRHPTLYGNLRSLHPGLFRDLKDHRRRSELGAIKKALYPIVYGGRRRFALEPQLRIWLHRSRVRPLDR